MLQTIRDRAQGWIAWVIIILISIPFALWGIQSYLGVGGEVVVANVNGVEITERDLQRRVQEARIQLRERLGAAYDAAQIDDRRLRREVLDDMIREALLVDVSDHLGFRVSDREIQAQILSEPAFQRGGQFDHTVYAQVLELQGLSPALFEAQLRQRMVGTQMGRGVVGSELITTAERQDFQRLSGQRREFSWLRIPAARFTDDTPIAEEAIQAYYSANLGAFQTPEQVRLEYLVLDVDTLAKNSAVSDEELARTYESDQARFGQPERRKVRHILLTVPADADEAKSQAVLAEIQGVRDRILSGESFADVAKAVSQDPGSASQGGSLGEIEQGIMDPAFDQAAFSLGAAQLSEPVRSRFGYHLIEVEEIIPARVKPFEEVKESLRAELARQKAESLFYDLGERLANVVYESPDSLQPAAEELGLSIQKSDWIARSGGEGLLGHPKVTAAAFSEEVLGQRRNSDLIEPEKDVLQALVVRVIDHREASTRPLEQVREEIVAALRLEQARKAAADAAKAGAEKLRGGADWAAVAGEDKPEEPGLVGRNDPKLPAPVRAVAFTLPAPAEGQASVGTAVFDDGDAAIVRVTRVEPGAASPQESGGADQQRSMLTQLMGRQAYESVLVDMERRAKIERKALPEPGEG
ncbi:MAG: SurA N-terminal domain-containing protein [Bdellovibrio bacteriovorus]